jgi:hypothetical protein
MAKARPKNTRNVATNAERAGCARSTVYEAIRALERLGVLSWVNRIKRVREYVPGLFGNASAWRWRVVRTSNAYAFVDPLVSSKSDLPTGTMAQDLAKKEIARHVPTGERHDLTKLWRTLSLAVTSHGDVLGHGRFYRDEAAHARKRAGQAGW